MKIQVPKLNFQVDLKLRLSLLLTLTLVLSAGFKYFQLSNQAKLFETYSRQSRGLLTKAEYAMQQQSKELDLAKSSLVSQKFNLEQDVENERNKYAKLSSQFKKYVKDNNLQISQYQRRLYSLQQTVASTQKLPAKVTIKYDETKCQKDLSVNYTYKGPHGRVLFHTPNCLKTGGETLKLNQSFVVYGEVYQQRNGLLKVSSLTLNEVSPNDPSVVLIKANLINSDFKYKSAPPTLLTRTFTLGMGATSNKDMFAGLGYIFYTWLNYDLSMSLNYGVQDSFHSTLNIAYSPIISGKKTNFSFQLGTGYTLKTSLIHTFGASFVLW